MRAAFGGYLDTLPDSHRGTVMFDVLDVVGRSGFGIGSAGLPAYSVLIEGFSQALDNDVVLSMKQGNVAAPSRVVRDERAAAYFEHHGHRTAISQRALQAHADRFLGWATLPGPDGPVGYVVSEVSPYEADLDWDDVSEPDDLAVLVTQLGQGDGEDPLRGRLRVRPGTGLGQRRGGRRDRASAATSDGLVAGDDRVRARLRSAGTGGPPALRRRVPRWPVRARRARLTRDPRLRATGGCRFLRDADSALDSAR